MQSDVVGDVLVSFWVFVGGGDEYVDGFVVFDHVVVAVANCLTNCFSKLKKTFLFWRAEFGKVVDIMGKCVCFVFEFFYKNRAN